MPSKKSEPKTDRIEREYVIPLREKCRVVPRYKKTNKAVKTVKEFLAKHMKVYDRDLRKIKLDRYLNEALWSRGIKHPPHKIKVKAVKEGDIVKAELSEIPAKLKFKKAREEKRETKAKESVEKKKSVMEKAKEGMTKPKTEEKTEEEKKEEQEKQKASAEATKQIEKATAKQARHQTKNKSKEPKHQRRMALAK